MKNRILGIVAALLLAAVGTAVLVTYVKGAERRALAGERTVEVLVVQAPIAKGTPAAEVGPLVEALTVPAKVRAEDSVASLDALDGHVAATDLVAGEQLLASRFVAPDELPTLGELDIPDGLQLVTVSLEPNRVLGGELQPGATVGVLASFADAPAEDGAASGSPTTHFILQRVLVARVQGEPQPTTGGAPDGAPATAARPAAPGGNLLVTFALNAPAAERLVFAAEHGTMWLSLQTDDTSADGTRVQTKETIYQ